MSKSEKIMAVSEAFTNLPDIYRVGFSSWTNGPKIAKIEAPLLYDRVVVYDKEGNKLHKLLKSAVNIHYGKVD